MNVLHVIPTVAPRYGGTSTFIRAVCLALAKVPGMHCEVAATDADGPTGYFTPDHWDVPAVPLHLFRAKGQGRLQTCPALADWLKTNAARFDVIHSHSVWNFPLYAARCAAVQAGKPFLLSPHGMLSRYTWARHRYLKLAAWWWRERANVRAAHAIHCTTDIEADELRHLRAIRGTVHVVPLGVDDEAWTLPADRTALREACGAAAVGKPIILFLSRLHPKKGIVDVLLPAFARLRNQAFLAIAGGADDSAPGYLAEVETSIRTLGLSERVAMFGSIPSGDRWKILDGADLFVLPSHQENFGLVVAEAMARGIPVAISDQVQIAPQVREAGGLVLPLNPTAWAEGMDGLLAKLVSERTIAAQGQAYARKHFEWAVTARRLSAIYQGLYPEKKQVEVECEIADTSCDHASESHS